MNKSWTLDNNKKKIAFIHGLEYRFAEHHWWHMIIIYVVMHPNYEFVFLKLVFFFLQNVTVFWSRELFINPGYIMKYLYKHTNQLNYESFIFFYVVFLHIMPFSFHTITNTNIYLQSIYQHTPTPTPFTR